MLLLTFLLLSVMAVAEIWENYILFLPFFTFFEVSEKIIYSILFQYCCLNNCYCLPLVVYLSTLSFKYWNTSSESYLVFNHC